MIPLNWHDGSDDKDDEADEDDDDYAGDSHGDCEHQEPPCSDVRVCQWHDPRTIEHSNRLINAT